ncbi:M15 family metallopeptidase [Sphingomonas canadensis]|uniref:M15 family metallopeptidase n=1 Tax=Sphingomonas canadensis TaxID=1219257 RepID=A0ABW3H848_9SPHN|nr:M15 family metallopeptidase [Sphingomonas canadensis]
MGDHGTARQAVRAILCILFVLAAIGPVAARASDGGDRPGAEAVAFLGHLPYPEAPRSELVPAPGSVRGGCMVHGEVREALSRMLASARADGVEIRLLSCFRSHAHQRQLFCRAAGGRHCADVVRAARTVAPPGHSEHSTGFAVDFTQRAVTCPDVQPCFAQTPAGRWLARNGAVFGFEMSFPEGNAQGVEWEPWHWRWIGPPGDGAGGATAGARLTFQRARAMAAARPGGAALVATGPAPRPAARPAARNSEAAAPDSPAPPSPLFARVASSAAWHAARLD